VGIWTFPPLILAVWEISPLDRDTCQFIKIDK